MTNSNIGGSSFIGSILDGTIFDGSKVYGSSVWDTKGTIKSQRDLIVTNDEAAVITVDNIKMAQFLYLLITNEEIKDAVDTLTSRVVLILGRFTPDRKQVLDQMKSSLRGMGLIPVIFDFEGPTSQDFTSTVQLLARISLFVIADLTDPKCIPHELYSIVPDLRTVPVQCIILQGVEPYAMFKDLKVYPWVMPLLHYESSDALLSNFQKDIFDPSKQKAEELRSKI
ncbi:MAG: hypothetical protein IPL92_13625 [Saprospiraceae bacterium]|nr:hypothetical protein [Candidatus Opimibacter iunctus]